MRDWGFYEQKPELVYCLKALYTRPQYDYFFKKFNCEPVEKRNDKAYFFQHLNEKTPPLQEGLTTKTKLKTT